MLTIRSGAGGREACAWVGMLLDMYSSWSRKSKRSFEVVEMSPNADGNPKSVTVIVKGAFDILSKESGVHRLSRISPFGSSRKRQTSFASVEVIPLMGEIEVKVSSSELKIDTFRSGGKGGQHQNTCDSGVRVTHLPTGTTAKSTNDRSQHANRRRAMEVLLSRLHEHEEDRRRSERGEVPKASFGHQRRSYILYPRKQIVDHLTGKKSGKVDELLKGDLGVV